MRHASIVLGTAIVLVFAAVTHAQRPAGITAEMIATALPVEGAPSPCQGLTRWNPERPSGHRAMWSIARRISRHFQEKTSCQ